MVGRLDLERYKKKSHGQRLTQFGDLRQGTDRAIARRSTDRNAAQELRLPEHLGGVYDLCRGGPRAPSARHGRSAVGRTSGRRPLRGGRPARGIRTGTGVNTDPLRQPGESSARSIRSLAMSGPRGRVCCTKVGATHPEEMYIVGAHMDGHGWGEAANDDGSGTALVMELARVLASPDVKTERSIRFVLWNNEETGLGRPYAYVAQRATPGQGGPGGFRSVSRAEMAGDDPARHDAVRPRHAARGRHHGKGAAAGGGREHRVQSRSKSLPPRPDLAWAFGGRQRKSTPPTIRRASAST